MNCQITPELQLGLSKLCKELQIFLNKTETSLCVAQEKFKHVENVIKPWEISDNSDSKQETCICKTLSNIQISENEEESCLLNTISKTLANAQRIRRKSSKTQSSNVAEIRNKTKTCQIVKKCSSVQTTSADNSRHSPCCPLFKSNVITSKQCLNLSDAVSFYKIPSVLNRTIRHCNKILSYSIEQPESTTKNSYKDIFFQLLETQNEEYCSWYKEKDSSISTFLTYLSALHSYEKKRINPNCDTWIFYRNVQSLESFQSSRCNIITKELWSTIINFIINDFLPVLEKSELNRHQKLNMFKTLKTICNFVYLSVPSVPIFRIEIKTTDS